MPEPGPARVFVEGPLRVIAISNAVVIPVTSNMGNPEREAALAHALEAAGHKEAAAEVRALEPARKAAHDAETATDALRRDRAAKGLDPLTGGALPPPAAPDTGKGKGG